jgi:phosphoesterase RecJ-like protein
VSINHAWQLIQAAKKIVLLTHQKPDADGISSCAALDYVLRGMGKKVQAVYPSKDESKLKRQPLDVRIAHHSIEPDLLIVCDTANYDRLYFPDSFKSVPMINIDHHVSNALAGTVNIVNAQAASTCEEVFHLLMAWCPEKVDRQVAEYLLFGMLYDTQVFHTTSTTSRSLKTAAACVDYGVNMPALARELLVQQSPYILPFWGKLLQKIRMDEQRNILWLAVTQQELKENNLGPEGLIGLNNFIAQFSPIDTVIVLNEDEKGDTKVSFRSKQRNVNKLAACFGGGGHVCAAGALIKKPVHEAIKDLLAVID